MNTEENKNEIIKEQIKIETNQDNHESSFEIDKEEIFTRKIRSLPVKIANFNLDNYRKRSESSSDILDKIEIINKAEKKEDDNDNDNNNDNNKYRNNSQK